MLISYWIVSIPLLDDAKLPKILLGIKISIFTHIWGVFVEKLKRGSEKAEIFVIL